MRDRSSTPPALRAWADAPIEVESLEATEARRDAAVARIGPAIRAGAEERRAARLRRGWFSALAVAAVPALASTPMPTDPMPTAG